MTTNPTPRKGDRVKVTYEGVFVGSRDCHILYAPDIHGNRTAPLDATIEILHPPIKAGDVLDAVEELERLPEWSVILQPNGFARTKNHGWDPTYLPAPTGGRVLHVGGTETK